MGLKKWKGITSKFVGTGPSSYEKRIYMAAVSQRLRTTALVCPYRQRSMRLWWDPIIDWRSDISWKKEMLSYNAAETLKLTGRMQDRQCA